MRRIPSQAWQLFLRNFTNEITFLSTDESYEWVERWFTAHYKPNYGRYSIVKDWENRDNTNLKYYLTPAYGYYYKWIGWSLFYISKDLEEATAKGGGTPMTSSPPSFKRDRIFIRIFGNKIVLEHFIESAKNEYLKSKIKGMKIFHKNYHGWIEKTERQYSSKPILKDNLYESVKADLEKFYSSYEEYRKAGILYKRGYIFHGSPGNGKTSFMLSLAFELKKNVYVMGLNKNQYSSDFIDAVCSVPRDGILIIEDIDCYSITHSREKDNEDDNLDLSTIINSLDGPLTPPGLVFFVTTNHIEKLDSALVRPGRIDVAVKIENPEREEIKQLYLRIIGSEDNFEEFYTNNKGLSMSSVQDNALLEKK